MRLQSMLHPFVVPLGLYDTGTICYYLIRHDMKCQDLKTETVMIQYDSVCFIIVCYDLKICNQIL